MFHGLGRGGGLFVDLFSEACLIAFVSVQHSTMVCFVSLWYSQYRPLFLYGADSILIVWTTYKSPKSLKANDTSVSFLLVCCYVPLYGLILSFVIVFVSLLLMLSFVLLCELACTLTFLNFPSNISSTFIACYALFMVSISNVWFLTNDTMKLLALRPDCNASISTSSKGFFND